MDNNNSIKLLVFLIIIALLSCLCFFTVSGITGWVIFKPSKSALGQTAPLTEVNTPSYSAETQNVYGDSSPTPASPLISTPAKPNQTATITSAASSSEGALESLNNLQQEIVPINDPIDLAERLGGKSNIPHTLPDENLPYQLGDEQSFWVVNTDTNVNFQVTAVLRYIGEHLYFWIEKDVPYNKADLESLASTFDEKIYPTNQEFFGTEWSPGIDNDPHIYALYAGGLGNSIAGYYSSADQIHPEAHPYSNAHEMFLINSDNVDLGREYIYGTMAHEFQHMIHWYNDRNEETWVNEGFSMLSELLNGYDAGSFDYLYSINPDLQLTDWGTEPGNNGPHYGASFLFMTYFLDRFGETATKALVAHPDNGMASIDAVMLDLEIINPDTTIPYTGNQVFADWAVANYILNPSVENGRYTYTSYTPFTINPTETISACPATKVKDVYQFGVDYIKIDCPGDHILSFAGVQEVKILPTDAYSGDYVFWSNMGDESNMSLTQEFDFTNTSAPIELSYKTWYELEEDYDYIFLSASVDGKKWQIIETSSCVTDNPSGNSYGCGYNGQSGKWLDENINLSQFAGQKVTLRFDYVTDAAVNGVGLYIDDIRIDAIDYFTDFETDEGGWIGEGFVRVQNYLPQTYMITLIEIGVQTTVTHIELSSENSANIEISIGGEIDEVILVISGVTPFTRQKAIYQYEIN